MLRTRMICVRIFYPVAALLRTRPIAEILSAFAKAVYRKHKTEGEPYFEQQKDYHKWINDAEYSFIFRNLPRLKGAIQAMGSRCKY